MDDIDLRVWVAVGFLSVLLLGALTFKLATRIAAPEPAQASRIELTVPQYGGLVPTSEQRALRLLGPVFSRKAEYSDCVIQIAFEASYTTDGAMESRLPFWLRNASDSVIAVVWDRCSIQLPNGDTVNIVHEDQVGSLGTVSSPPTSLAPGGDLLNAVFPISEVEWIGNRWAVSSNVLDRAPFSLILALDVGGRLQYYVFRFMIR